MRDFARVGPRSHALAVLCAIGVGCGDPASGEDSAASSLSDPSATASGGSLESAGTDPSTSGGSVSGSETAGSDTSSGGETSGGPAPLTLSVDVTDGACVDLGITDRLTYAARFSAGGPPGATVDLMVSRPACGVEPFAFQQLVLDDDGVAFYDLDHGGSDTCAEPLLGEWDAWVTYEGEVSEVAQILFASSACAGAESCGAAAEVCPSEEAPPYIPKDSLFVLSDEERPIFDPPDPGWAEFGMAYEDYPLENLWKAFDAGMPVAPLDPNAGPAGWYELDGTGSQNHSLLWLGVSALGYALAEDVENFENAAEKCLLLLELDAEQGHMRHEAVGFYTGFWEGGIATMALAGLYAPERAPTGGPLLEASRAWWTDHIAVLRRLATPDGQVALTGARLWGEPGERDSWGSLSVAINLQLVDPRPYEELHPTIALFLTADGEPKPVDKGVPCRWYRGRHVAERWIVLRAVQSGALLPVPEEHPPPSINTPVWRWTEGDAVHVATDAVKGYRPARWHVRWKPSEVLEVLIGDPTDYPHTGKGPHSPPVPLTIPEDAELVLSP